MRYRPFGISGMAVSAVSLLLRDGALSGRRPDWRGFVLSALEAGVNTFEIAGSSPALLEGLGEALAAVERRLVFVAWQLDAGEAEPLTAERLSRMLDHVMAGAGLDYLDLVMLHDPAPAVSLETISLLRDLQGARRTRLLGVSGAGEAVDGHMGAGVFQALALPYNLTCGWTARNRLKQAAALDMAVIGCDVWPAALRELKPERLGKRRLFGPRPHPLKGVGGYQFLHDCPGWSGEEICLAYALTEPAITTVQIEADGIERLQRLAATAERDLPTGVAAQIEMARFSTVQRGAA